MPLRPGQYAIINRKSGTALTVSDGLDPRAITGNQYEGTANQKFDLVDLGGKVWEIRTVDRGDFVSVLGLHPTSKIFAVPTATKWIIDHCVPDDPDSDYFASPVNTELSMSLAHGGSPAPGTPVELAIFSPALDSQAWEFRPLSSD